MSERPDFPAELLAEHTEFLRRLARRLVRDEPSAEDLVQETLTIALSSRHRVGLPVRAWLAGVLRNTSRAWSRSAAWRNRRELRAARDESIESRANAELEAQESLLAALSRLDEPVRATLLLRFQQDMSLREIAAHRGESVSAVKSRVSRGLASLRLGLDSQGERGRSRRALFLLAWGPSATPPRGLPHLPRETTMRMIAATGVVTTLAVVLPFRFDAPSAVPAEASSSPTIASSVPQLAPVAVGAAVPTPRVDASTAEPTPTTVESTSLVGRVIDATTGAPVAGIPIVDQVGTAIGVSNAEGHFDASATGANDELRAGPDSGFATVGLGVLAGNAMVIGEPARSADRSPLVVVARERSLAGRVVSPSGAPIPNARVFAWLPADWTKSIGLTTRGTRGADPSTETDEAGEFAFDSMPDLEGMRLLVRLDEPWRRFETTLAPGPLEDMVITLPDTRTFIDPIEGRVVDGDGAAIANAHVVLGKHAAKTDTNGIFEIESAGTTAATRLRTAPPGKQMVERAPTVDAEGNAAWPSPLVLVADRPLRSITGRVLDPSGSPAASMVAMVLDPTPLGRTQSGLHMRAESASSPQGALFAFGDERGEFELHGLYDRAYLIEVIDSDSGGGARVTIDATSIETVEITLEPEPERITLRGRCVDESSQPMAGVVIAPVLDVRPGALDPEGTDVSLGPSTTTDANGAFELSDVLETVELLALDGAAAYEHWSIPTGTDLADFVVHTRPVCVVRVEAGEAWKHCDRFSLLRDGEAVHHGVPGQETSRRWSRLTLGRSGLIEAPCDIDAIALEVEGVRVVERPVHIDRTLSINVLAPQ